jgi:hypothetical protein
VARFGIIKYPFEYLTNAVEDVKEACRATLLAARAAAREKEMAIRVALGGSRASAPRRWPR